MTTENKQLKQEIKELKEKLKFKEEVCKELQKQADDEHVRYLDIQVKASNKVAKLKKEKDRWENRFKEKCSEGRRPLCLKQIDEYKKENEELKKELEEKDEIIQRQKTNINKFLNYFHKKKLPLPF